MEESFEKLQVKPFWKMNGGMGNSVLKVGVNY